MGAKVKPSPIYFDARYIRVDHHDGISRFSAGLCAALAKKTEVIAIIWDERQLRQLPENIGWIKLNDPTKPLSEFFISTKLNKLGAKFVFSPMQTMSSAFKRYKLILTLHDLIYYSHPTPPPSFSLPIRLGWRLFHLTYVPQRLMLNGADGVATVSNTTKRLMQKNRLTRRPISVVYNAAALQTGVKHRDIPGKKLTYMGSFMDYKNVECLIDALPVLEDYELHLLSKITPNRREELRRRAGSAGSRIIFHNGITDVEYREILNDSFALVSASKDEGFGIPVIEAMSQGTPAVISDIEIFREIGGEAALFFDPELPGSMVAAVRKLEKEWKARSEASKLQASEFSWDKSADALVQAFSSL